MVQTGQCGRTGLQKASSVADVVVVGFFVSFFKTKGLCCKYTFMLAWFLPTVLEALIINHLIVARFFCRIGRLNKNATVFLRHVRSRAPLRHAGVFPAGAGMGQARLKGEPYKMKYAINGRHTKKIKC